MKEDGPRLLVDLWKKMHNDSSKRRPEARAQWDRTNKANEVFIESPPLDACKDCMLASSCTGSRGMREGYDTRMSNKGILKINKPMEKGELTDFLKSFANCDPELL